MEFIINFLKNILNYYTNFTFKNIQISDWEDKEIIIIKNEI